MNYQEQNRLNRNSWAQDFLKYIGAPVYQNNVNFVIAWQRCENSSFKFNPLATTWKLNNSTGILEQNYDSLNTGFEATKKTLFNGKYENIRFILMNNAGVLNQRGAGLVDLKYQFSTWGTNPDTFLKVFSEIKNNPVAVAEPYVVAENETAGFSFNIIFILILIFFFTSNNSNKLN